MDPDNQTNMGCFLCLFIQAQKAHGTGQSNQHGLLSVPSCFCTQFLHVFFCVFARRDLRLAAHLLELGAHIRVGGAVTEKGVRGVLDRLCVDWGSERGP